MINWVFGVGLVAAFILIGVLFYRQRNMISLRRNGDKIILSDKKGTVKIERVEV